MASTISGMPVQALGLPVRRRALRTGLLLLALLVLALLALVHVDADSLVPATWPAAGITAGLLLTSPHAWRRWVALTAFVITLAAFLLGGQPVLVALGFSATSVAAAAVVRLRLLHGLDGRRAELRSQGDVSRLIGSTTVGSAVAAAGYALTAWATGHGSPALAALAALGSYAAALMMLLPLFLETLSFEPLAGPRERVLQAVISIGTTIAVFSFADAPPVVFAVMPMFAWHAFRGTLREATLLLTLVGLVGTGMTLAGIGPIHGLGPRYGLEPELVNGVLQLFLLDCGLILLPLSVMVTQQRMATTRADAERETLQRLVASATGTAVVATGPDGRILLFNPGAEAMLGCAAEDALGQLPDRFFSSEELQRQAADLRALPNFADLCRATVALPDSHRLWQFHGPEGDERTMRVALSRVPDASGRLSGYLLTGEDVTEREAAHRALIATLEHERNAMDQLRELERVKGDFVATVSHELRTPITSIMGYTEVLEDGAVGELSPSQLEILGRVDRNTRRLLLLVEDLLTLSKIESSTLKIEPVDTDLARVVRGARDALEESLASRALAIEVDVPEGPVRHQGDPVQLQRMVHGLLTNAVKFTPDGGTVAVSLRAEGDRHQLVVRDTGMGIPEAEQERLFTRFFRSSTATLHAIQGSGLGLTIVRAIVTLHGGEIAVASREGEGTTVTVDLPRALGAQRSVVA